MYISLLTLYEPVRKIRRYKEILYIHWVHEIEHIVNYIKTNPLRFSTLNIAS
jgi:hypothetical protein